MRDQRDAASSVTETAPDPFDPAALRLTGDAEAAAGVREVLLTVPVRKPDKSWFVRVHPDEAYALKTYFVEVKGERDGDLYLVAPSKWPALAGEPTFSPRMLFTAISTTDVLFLWPVRLPGPDGRIDDYNRSALEIAELARSSWHRVYADQYLGAYRTKTPEDLLPDPIWPELSLQELLRVGFKERRYEKIDPANRLVAAELESRWEQALKDRERLRRELEEFDRQVASPLSAAERRRIRALSTDLTTVWNASTTAMTDRKELLRFLVHRVYLDGVTEPGQIRVTIEWHTGTRTTVLVPRLAVGAWAPKTSETVVQRIRELLPTWNSVAIAKKLNREGLRTAKGMKFDLYSVGYIVRSRKLNANV